MTIPIIRPLPTPPSRSQTADAFNASADAFIAGLPQFQSDSNAFATAANSQASVVDSQTAVATAQATAAANSAASASASLATVQSTANASVWISGTSYAQYSNVISPANFQTYRKKTATSSSTTDPSNDTTNWTLLQIAPTWIVKNSNYTAVPFDRIAVDVTSNSVTITLPASPVAGQTTIEFCDYAKLFGAYVVTFARNGNLIEGLSQDMIVSTKGASGKLLYIDSVKGWINL